MIQIPLPSDTLAELEQMACAKNKKFKHASNTIEMLGNYEREALRGLVGEWAWGYYLQLPDVPNEDQSLPYDFTTADGFRVDVKTSSPPHGIMVNKKQRYKIDPERLDAFALAYWGIREKTVKLVGWIGIVPFLQEAILDTTLKFPAWHMRPGYLRDPSEL